MKKIKAKDIKPGMALDISTRKGWPDIVIVTAIDKADITEIEYTFFSLNNYNYGPLIGTIHGKQSVEVITGKKRKYIIEKIIKQSWKRYHEVKRDLETIKLIEALSK